MRGSIESAAINQARTLSCHQCPIRFQYAEPNLVITPHKHILRSRKGALLVKVTCTYFVWKTSGIRKFSKKMKLIVSAFPKVFVREADIITIRVML